MKIYLWWLDDSDRHNNLFGSVFNWHQFLTNLKHNLNAFFDYTGTQNRSDDLKLTWQKKHGVSIVFMQKKCWHLAYFYGFQVNEKRILLR